RIASVTCLTLFMHWIRLALSLARESAGRIMAARMAMMAMTTNSSIRVKASLGRLGAGEQLDSCRLAPQAYRADRQKGLIGARVLFTIQTLLTQPSPDNPTLRKKITILRMGCAAPIGAKLLNGFEDELLRGS